MIKSETKYEAIAIFVRITRMITYIYRKGCVCHLYIGNVCRMQMLIKSNCKYFLAMSIFRYLVHHMMRFHYVTAFKGNSLVETFIRNEIVILRMLNKEFLLYERFLFQQKSFLLVFQDGRKVLSAFPLILCLPARGPNFLI